MTTEVQVFDRVKAGLRDAARQTPHKVLELFRVENTAARGFPDVFGRWASFSFWIELKMMYHGGIKFQAGQVDFLSRQWAASRNAFVLVGVDRYDFRLFRGDQAKELEEKRRVLEVAPELLLHTPIDWKELLERLTWGGCDCGCTE